MSGLGIKVRCLASTRVSTCGKLQQEKDQNENGEDVRTRGGLDGTEEEGVDVSGLEEVSEQLADAQPEDDSIEINSKRSPSQDSASSSSGTDTDDSSESTSLKRSHPGVRNIGCIQEAQLSVDGSCIFTSSWDRTFSVYPLDGSILSETNTRSLVPYASFRSAEPIWAFVANPLFNVQDRTSTTVLVSRRDSYITLHNALWDTSSKYPPSSSPTSPVNISTPLASYKLINNLTEAVTAPLSLAYSNDGLYFFAGIQDSIATFDLLDPSSPLHSIPTIPAKRNKLKGGGRGFKGHISSLSLSPPSSTTLSGFLAAGSWTRYIGIYDPLSGGEITSFPLPGTLNGKKIRNEKLKDVMGDGVSSLKWSPCGKYLYVAERASDSLLIFDVRNFSLALGYCKGRKALTRQKLGFDVWNAGASPYDVEGLSHEVWAGGTDGKIRVWRDPYVKEGAVEADEVVHVGGGEEGGPVTGTMVHKSGSLAVAARGVVGLGDGEGWRRGVGVRPRVREWGSLDILGLG